MFNLISISINVYPPLSLLQISYLLVVILELNSVSEVQYKEIIMIDDK